MTFKAPTEWSPDQQVAYAIGQQSEPRIIPSADRRPEWPDLRPNPNAPARRPAEAVEFDPEAHRRAALVEVLGGCRVGVLALTYTRDCLRAVGDRSHDVDLNTAAEWLERIRVRYLAELGEGE